MKLIKNLPSSPLGSTVMLSVTQRECNFVLSRFLYYKNMVHQYFRDIVNSNLSSREQLSAQPNQKTTTKSKYKTNQSNQPPKNATNKLKTDYKEKYTINSTQKADFYHYIGRKDTIPGLTQNHEHWKPLTKVTTPHQPDRGNIAPKSYVNKHALAGESILYIGGRAALYAQYRRLITSIGGRLVIYRSSSDGNFNRLYTLLENADRIICPVDCVDHHDFFAVKYYCKFSGKPFTLLDRSNLAALNKAIKQ